MTVIIRTDLPLEQRLEEAASSPNTSFPDRNAAYWHRYVQIKQLIADEYYQSAGAGLALQGERFTRHDITHVDDVIDMAGRLLGNGCENSLLDNLSPYEIYVLLFAILLHDAGNARERKEHEKEPKAIIARLGPLPKLNPPERRIIASIAEAHGGRTPSGSKDTIRNIIPDDEITIGSCSIRARMLAAVLRLADELSENSHRADPQALIRPYKPPQSAIHNLYCKVIDVRIEYRGRAVYLGFSVSQSQLAEEFALNESGTDTILLVDYIAQRVEKCDLERQYCNRFLRLVTYEKISVKLEIYDESDNVIDTLRLELVDEGYPVPTRTLHSIEPRFDGQKLRTQHATQPSRTGAAP